MLSINQGITTVKPKWCFKHVMFSNMDTKLIIEKEVVKTHCYKNIGLL